MLTKDEKEYLIKIADKLMEGNTYVNGFLDVVGDGEFDRKSAIDMFKNTAKICSVMSNAINLFVMRN